jgi:hypothetical protein
VSLVALADALHQGLISERVFRQLTIETDLRLAVPDAGQDTPA